MSDEALCYGVLKPKFPPSYYTTHNIIPSPGNDWVCRVSGWEWQQTVEEKIASAVVEKELEDKPYTSVTREMYSSIVYNGVKYEVYTDSKGDYITVNSERCYLLSTWWVTYEGRRHGEKFIKKCVSRPPSIFGGGEPSEPTGDCPRGRQYQAPTFGNCDPGYYREKLWGKDLCVCEKGPSAETSWDKLGKYLSGNLKMILIVIVVIVIGMVIMKVASKKVSVG